MNVNVKKTLTTLITILPLLALLGTGAMWVDTRYMHKQISDTRYIDLQIKIVQGHIREYERLKTSDAPLTMSDESNYNTDLRQLDNLLSERNKLLGI
jgi:hypothetical protein